jgi:hypothetical protein
MTEDRQDLATTVYTVVRLEEGHINHDVGLVHGKMAA